MSWREVERRMRQCLEDWRATLWGDVTQLRQAFRRVLTGPVLFTPFQKGERRGVRFEGKIGLAAVFDGYIPTEVVTRVGIEPTTIRLKVECSTTELPGRLNRAPLGACYLGAT